jgi:hypothetical protein
MATGSPCQAVRTGIVRGIQRACSRSSVVHVCSFPFSFPHRGSFGYPWANSARWQGILRAPLTRPLLSKLEPEGLESLSSTEGAGGLGRQKGHQRAPILAARFPARGSPTPTAVGLLKA